MAVTFTRAATVAPGDPITSTQLAKLADAFNDRLRSGLGDGPWRLRYYWLSLFRQVRNPDASGFLWPAMAEFFEKFQGLDPDVGEWPETEPGEPEGANVASQMMAFIFGNDSFAGVPVTFDPPTPADDLWKDAKKAFTFGASSLLAEDIRLGEEESGGIPLALGVLPPTNAAEFWELAKRQRGAYDPESGLIGSPAIQAAQSYGAIYYSPYSPHGNSYGDFMPGPQDNGVCDDPDLGDDFPAPQSFDVFFTKLDTSIACPSDTTPSGNECHYEGTCPIGPDTVSDYSKHIAGIAETAWSYYVFLNDGTVHALPKNKWIIGPFTANAVLRKQGNNILARMLNAFASEFRGTDAQRESGTWNGNAFDFQRFLTEQYQLAPNIGTVAGDSVFAAYPSATFGPSDTDGTIHGSHTYRDGFVIGGAVATATGLGSPVTIEVLNGSEVIGRITLTPDAGEASGLVIFHKRIVPAPLKFRLRGHAHLASTGSIQCEATELAEYKPQMQDLYALLRLSGISFSATVDGRGIDQEQSKLIGENYFTTGCILSVNGDVAMPGSLTAANTNAVFDASRRASQMVRIMNREQFIGYEVADGKSILYFNRLGWAGQDMFYGIAPPREEVESGSIQQGIVYEVRDANVTYDGHVYVVGQTFTGGTVTEWTGTGHVFEHEGIRATAPREGFTNEWLTGFEFKAYHLGEASVWKPEAYGDYWPLTNRCLFYSPEIASDRTLLWHVAFGQRVLGPNGNLIAEAPTGYNYATLPDSGGNVNTVNCSGDPVCQDYLVNFYKSCRIYEREPEIESATVIVEGGTEVVKLVYKTRFHHAPSAPGTISRDYSTWVAADIHAEEFRSVENALRQYLLHAYFGGNCSPGGVVPMGGAPTGMPGNASVRSDVQSLADNPFGSCYPHFGFTKLMPKPWIDDNDKQDKADTPLLHDSLRNAETMLRAMCEGYIDGPTTTANVCGSGDASTCSFGTVNLFAYNFPNLMFQASGGTMQWIPFLPSVATEFLKAPNIREDKPEGFGPLPNTYTASETFNLLANAVNLLTDVRVMLPMLLECRRDIGTQSTVYSSTFNANDEAVPPNADSYSGVSDYAVWLEGVSPALKVPDTELDPWGDCASGIVAEASGQDISWNDATQEMTVSTQNITVNWRWTLVDPDAINAIPPEWQDMLSTDALMLACRRRRATAMHRHYRALNSGAPCGSSNAIWDGATQGLDFDTVTTLYSDACEIMATSGSISPPPLPPSVYAVGDGVGIEGPCAFGPITSDEIMPIDATDAMIRVPLV